MRSTVNRDDVGSIPTGTALEVWCNWQHSGLQNRRCGFESHHFCMTNIKWQQSNFSEKGAFAKIQGGHLNVSLKVYPCIIEGNEVFTWEIEFSDSRQRVPNKSYLYMWGKKEATLEAAKQKVVKALDDWVKTLQEAVEQLS